ncbi:MAG: LCP family protein [Anaerotignum sp.]|nr:LCP family protein [Anaerotignum sp.]
MMKIVYQKKNKGGISLKEERRKRLMRLYFKTLAITLAVCIGLMGVGYGAFLYMVGGMNRSDINEENLSANEGIEGIINIALYGVDSTTGDFNGRSDAIMICSVNGETEKIKLVSIARDTYVSVPGYYNTKINHAYAYGGAELAVQTLNENFDMDITDYVTVNFDSLADIIDEMGGVTIDVTDAERFQINAYLRRGEPLREIGMVNLNGAQAVSYSRIRKIDSDNMRASRQREVLSALFDKALEINPLSYPSYVRKFSPMVETSLSNEEMLKIATAVIGGSAVSLEQAAFPNDQIYAEGQTIDGAWYYVYDLEQATDMLHQYIYEDIPFAHYGLTEEEIAALSAEE